MTAATEPEKISREERFTLHGLKHRGHGQKKEASDHKIDAMLDQTLRSRRGRARAAGEAAAGL